MFQSKMWHPTQFHFDFNQNFLCFPSCRTLSCGSQCPLKKHREHKTQLMICAKQQWTRGGVTPALATSRRLPVAFSIDFTVLALFFKAWNDSAPTYVCARWPKTAKCVRSMNSAFLCISAIKCRNFLLFFPQDHDPMPQSSPFIAYKHSLWCSFQYNLLLLLPLLFFSPLLWCVSHFPGLFNDA